MKILSRRVLVLASTLVVLIGLLLVLIQGKSKSQRASLNQESGVSLESKTIAINGGEAAEDLARWLVKKGNENALVGRLQYSLFNWELAHFLDPLNTLAETKFKKGLKSGPSMIRLKHHS